MTVVPAAHEAPRAPGDAGDCGKILIGSKSLLFVAAVVVVMLGVAGVLYMQQQRAAQPTTTADNQATAAPAAAPAMAPQAGSPGDGRSAIGGGSPTPAATAPVPSVAGPIAAPPAAVPATVPAAPAPTSAAGRLSPTAQNPSPASAAARPSPVAQSPSSTAAAPVVAAAAPQPPPASPAPAAFPANPAVFFQCRGAAEICSPLRTALDAELDKAKLPNVRSADRADVTVMATASVVQETSNRSFGTTFNVRNYSIDVAADATKLGETVSMPPQASLSFDPAVGAERANEKARVMAGDIVQKLQAFAARKKQ